MSSSFDALTTDERLQRMDELAERALAAFALSGAQREFLSYTNNVLYRVNDGQQMYVLRVHRPGLKRLEWLQSELMWLQALCQAGISAPQPVNGVHTGMLDGYAGEVYCTLLRWIDGESIPTDDLTTEHVETIGRYAAQLHNFSADYVPPSGFIRPNLDYAGLFGEQSPYYPGADAQAMIDRLGGEVIAAIMARVYEVMQTLDQLPDSFGMIHADLLPKNLLWNGDAIAAIDFDDSAFGYFLYDLAPILLGLKTRKDYDALVEALWTGYASQRALPADFRTMTETLVAGRYVASIRWVAGNTGHPAIIGKAEQIITQRIEQLRATLQTGRLQLIT